jgi:hypothetical protein
LIARSNATAASRPSVSSWLVDQKQVRAGGDSDGEGHELLLAPREVIDPLAGQWTEVELVEHRGWVLDPVPGAAGPDLGEPDVLLACCISKQVGSGVLEDHAYLSCPQQSQLAL